MIQYEAVRHDCSEKPSDILPSRVLDQCNHLNLRIIPRFLFHHTVNVRRSNKRIVFTRFSHGERNYFAGKHDNEVGSCIQRGPKPKLPSWVLKSVLW
jgi:hypothetical protein